MPDLKNIRLQHNFATRLALVFVALCALTGLLAHITFWLSGSGQVDMARIEAIPQPERQASEPEALHQVAEWPQDKGRAFSQAPALDARVQSGDLPPVSERLPQNPLVIHPAHQLGPYGGTWARHGTSPSDIGIFEHRLAYDGLVRWDPMGREILPNLASHWDIEDE